MSPFFSPFSKKSPARAVRRKKSGRKDAQVNLDLMQLEPRLVMAPNVLAPETTAANPFGFPAGTLNLSGALAVSLLDTPTPASTAPFQVTVASSAGTASVGSPANVTVLPPPPVPPPAAAKGPPSSNPLAVSTKLPCCVSISGLLS